MRRNFSPLVLGGGLLLLGQLARTEIPRDQQVRFVLAPGYPKVRAVRVTYLDHGEFMSSVEFRPSARPGAPLVHHPSLRPGQYDLAVAIEDQSGHVRSITRKLTVPSDTVTIRLQGEPAP